MIKLDDDLLQELGLAALPPEEKKKMLAHIYETLEMRVGMELAKQMSDAQLSEFEEFINRNDEAGALRWLETNFPNYKDVVAAEFEKLKMEIRQVAPQILNSSQQAAAAAVAAGQQPMPQQQSVPPVQQQQYAPQAYQQPPQPQAMQPQYAAPQPGVMPQQPQYPQPQMPPAYGQPPQYPQQLYGPAMPQQPGQQPPLDQTQRSDYDLAA
jgi:hypothetical protein